MSEAVGFKVGNLTPELREKLDLSGGTKGVVVLEVDPSSWAARKGVRKHDVIRNVKVKGSAAVAVKNVAQFRKVLKPAKAGTAIVLYLERNGRSFLVALKVG
jgi:serine protease Do